MKKIKQSAEDISRKEAIKKLGNCGKYAALTALGTFLILSPQSSQASSAPSPPPAGNNF